MATMNFHSNDTSLHALDVDHGDAGLAIERIMAHPAYLDPHHILHHRAVSDVTERLALLHGEGPTAGSAGFCLAFDSATGKVISAEPSAPLVVNLSHSGVAIHGPAGGPAAAPAVAPAAALPAPMLATGQGLVDEHNFSD